MVVRGDYILIWALWSYMSGNWEHLSSHIRFIELTTEPVSGISINAKRQIELRFPLFDDRLFRRSPSIVRHHCIAIPKIAPKEGQGGISNIRIGRFSAGAINQQEIDTWKVKLLLYRFRVIPELAAIDTHISWCEIRMDQVDAI